VYILRLLLNGFKAELNGDICNIVEVQIHTKSIWGEEVRDI
jgi:hypothetical protein